MFVYIDKLLSISEIKIEIDLDMYLLLYLFYYCNTIFQINSVAELLSSNIGLYDTLMEFIMFTKYRSLLHTNLDHLLQHPGYGILILF